MDRMKPEEASPRPSPMGEGVRALSLSHRRGTESEALQGEAFAKSKLLFFSIFLVISSTLFAQTGKIEYKQDARVDTLVNRYTRVNESHASIEGYRIQITAGSNRTNVYQIKSQFYTAFPDIKQYIIYQAPNFKLRVGNYRTRLEAYKDLQEILQRFNGSFIIQDEIKLSEL